MRCYMKLVIRGCIASCRCMWMMGRIACFYVGGRRGVVVRVGGMLDGRWLAFWSLLSRGDFSFFFFFSS